MLRRTNLLALAIVYAVACSSEPPREEPLAEHRAALGVSDALTFDNPAHWTVSLGTKAGSSIKTQGTGSIQVTTTYYTELSAKNLTPPPSVGEKFSFDLRVDEELGWGEVRVVLVSQSLNLWQQIGVAYPATLAPDQFHHVEFPLSPAVRQKLSQNYSDLEVRLIFDAPPTKYWVDNGSFGSSAPSSCNDGVKNGRETEKDCGGACAPCGAAVPGIVWYDKFTNGLGQWTTTSGYSTAPLAHSDDYAESGSGSPAATASGSATLTSPVINLSALSGIPLLSFHRLINATAGSVTGLEVKQGSSWELLRNLSANGANDNRWRTEFVPLDAWSGSTNFQFRFVTSGTTTFQIDDVSITDRSRVDSHYTPPSFVMTPGAKPAAVMTSSRTWQWRIRETDPWSQSFIAGPFMGSEDGGNGLWPKPDPEANPVDLWIRTTLDISSSENRNNLRFWARWDDTLTIKVNGVTVVDRQSWSPSYQYIVPSTNAFVVGPNDIEVHAQDFVGSRYLDVGITRNVGPTSIPEVVSPASLAHGGSHPLAGFANLLYDYVLTRHAPGVAFALYKDGTRVFEAAYGYRDAALTQPMPLNPIMRIASVDKGFSAAAAMKLINEGFELENEEPLTRDTPIFPTLRTLYGFPATMAQAGPYVDQVTVGHLIDHMGHVINFEEGGNGDFYSVIGGTRGHTTRHDNARYIHNRGCFRQPGTGPSEYNSGGYMLLRYFLDQIVPGGILGYVQSNFHEDVMLSHESLLGRNSREPWYATQVIPYDRWLNFEHYTGLAASPRAVAELAVGYDPHTGEAVPYGGVTEGCSGIPGGMAGSIAYSIQCERGIAFGLMFNSHQDGGGYDDLVDIVREYAFSLPDSAYVLPP